MKRARRVPDLESLRIFTEVASAGSFTAAGSVLQMTQQAVSLRTRRLEQSLGFPLLSRSSRGVELTLAGGLVVEWAAALLSASEAFSTAVDTLQSDRRREFRVAASLTIAEHLLPHWLTRWNNGAQAPIVHLTATNSTAVIDLIRRGAVELGFIETPDIPVDLSSTTIAHDRLLLVTAPTHPWAQRRVVTPSELARTPLLAREEGSGTRRMLEHALHAAGALVVAPPAAVISSSLGIRTAAATGYAPAVLSTLSVVEDLRSGRLTDIHASEIDLTRPLTAVWIGEPTTGISDFLRNVAEGLAAS